MRRPAAVRARDAGAVLLVSLVVSIPVAGTSQRADAAQPGSAGPARACAPAGASPAAPVAPIGLVPPAPSPAVRPATARRWAGMTGHRTVGFVENRGQLDGRVRFYSHEDRAGAWLTESGVVVASGSGAGRERVAEERFVGAGRPRISVHGPAARVDVLVGPRERWRVGLRAHPEVRYRGVWQGIDVRFVAGRGALRRDYLVRPGADPARIRFALRGVERLGVERDGSLAVHTAAGVLRQPAPHLFQHRGGRRVAVRGGYRLLGRARYGLWVGRYASARPLVIDPTLVYSTYVGGSDSDVLRGVAVDGAGSTYAVGATRSSDYPASNARSPGGSTDVVVTKLRPGGRGSAYSVYLGGDGQDVGRAIAVDEDGSAWLTGTTESADFPTKDAFQPAYRGEGPPQGRFWDDGDAFVARLDPQGGLAFASYLGGADDDTGNAIAVGPRGAVVAGQTLSADFPVAAPLQPRLAGTGRFDGGDSDFAGDAFLARVGRDGRLRTSTFLGGGGPDEVHGMALGEDGSVHLAGETQSPDFPFVRALQSMPADGSAGFLARVRPDGTAVDFATPLGGAGYDAARDVALAPDGSALVTGTTHSRDFPTLGAMTPRGAVGGNADAFVASVDTDQARLRYATFVGGTLNDRAAGIAVDPAGQAVVVGTTQSSDFPTVGAIDASLGGTDAFVATLAADGRSLRFATLLGGARGEDADDVAVDRGGNVYVTGDTSSEDLPLQNAFQPLFDGRGEAGFTRDGFLAEIAALEIAPLAATRISPDHGGQGRVTFALVGAGMLPGATVRLRRAGRSDVVARGVVVRGDVGLTGTFDLGGRAPGAWDVVVRNPDGARATLRRGFTVARGGGHELTLDILGRSRLRAGREATTTFVVGNRGNVDARGVLLWLRGIPADAKWRLDTEVRRFPLPAGAPAVDWDDVPLAAQRGDELVIPLYLPLVAAGSSGLVRLTLSVPSRRDLQLRATMNEPLFASPISAATGACVFSVLNLGLTAIGMPSVNLACRESAAAFMAGVLGGLDEDLALMIADSAHGGTLVFSWWQAAAGYASLVAGCVGTPLRLVPWLGAVASVADVLDSCAGIAVSRLFDLGIFGSVDPNDKRGPAGAGRARHVAGGAALPYTILFENLPGADAPAEVVTVEDRLDPRRFDLETFAFGPVSFGERVVVPPAGARALSADVDLRPAKDVRVRIDGRLEPRSGRVVWTFRSLDPLTAERPEDPLAGFLPPNRAPPEGEGAVVFSVAPRRGLPTGTRLRNRATITFDTNAPIRTGRYENRIDAAPPTSRAATGRPLPRLAVPVRWRGRDRGSGVQSFDLYVSRDGGPRVRWLKDVRARAATFVGPPGRYSFSSVGRDRVGNVESAGRRPDAIARIRPPTPGRGHAGAPRVRVVRAPQLRLVAGRLALVARVRVDEPALLRATVMRRGRRRPLALAAGSFAGGRPASLPASSASGVRPRAGIADVRLVLDSATAGEARRLRLTLVARDREGRTRTVRARAR